MSRSRNRRRPAAAEPTAFDLARDELFQHIMHCDVIGAEPEHQAEWFNATMDYMTERWPELSPKQRTDLRTLGERFAKPARSSAPAQVVEAPVEGAVTAEHAVESLDTVSA